MPTSLPKYYFILLFSVIAWCCLIILPPVLGSLNAGGSLIGDYIYAGFSKICHQYDSRSFQFAGYKFAVCSRCTAIYFGFLAGLMVWGWKRGKMMSRARVWWMVAMLPMVIDVFLDMMSIHESTFLTRTISGSVFGGVASCILTPVFIVACSEFVQRRYQSKGISS